MRWIGPLMAALLVLVGAARAQETCFDNWDENCTFTAAVVAGWLMGIGLDAMSLAPAGFVPPPGAGEVIAAEPVLTCQLTPSTGQGSGMNLRAAPSLDAPVIGDMALGDYREVTAISTTWYQTVTRDGRAAFAAAAVSTLVGPCGDVPRFVVTPD